MGEPSPLRNPLGTRGSACVEVMTTLHGSTLSPWRRVEGCVPRLPWSQLGSIILFMVSFWFWIRLFILELEIDWSRFQSSQIDSIRLDEMSYDSLPPTPTTQLANDIVEEDISFSRMGDLIDMVFFMMGLRWTCWMIMETNFEPTNVDQLKKYYV
ncbi:hypothetical protein AAG906_019009 [Vitis piasezkii]